jgi:hypothetical protein
MPSLTYLRTAGSPAPLEDAKYVYQLGSISLNMELQSSDFSIRGSLAARLLQVSCNAIHARHLNQPQSLLVNHAFGRTEVLITGILYTILFRSRFELVLPSRPQKQR